MHSDGKEISISNQRIKQENPSRSQDFQEPKTKIYETFYLQPKNSATGLYDKNRCKNTIFFKNHNHFFPKNRLFFTYWKIILIILSFQYNLAVP
jgi:hypothetical protein